MFTSILVFTVISGILMCIIGLAIPSAIAFALGQLFHLGVFDIQRNNNKFMGCFWILIAGVCWFGFLIVLGIGIFTNEDGIFMIADTIGYILLVGFFAVLTYLGFHTTVFVNTEIDDPIEDKFKQVIEKHEFSEQKQSSSNMSVSLPDQERTQLDPNIKQVEPHLANQDRPMIVNFDQPTKSQATSSVPSRKVPVAQMRRRKHVRLSGILY